jgi:hypothetical protein
VKTGSNQVGSDFAPLSAESTACLAAPAASSAARTTDCFLIRCPSTPIVTIGA